MNQISVINFITGVKTICSENPFFKTGHDGSDNKCDGMGLIRGGLLRGGATKIRNMKEPNQFARMVATNIRKIDLDIPVGSILLKTNNDMQLPTKYRIISNGSDFNNYVDVGIVILDSPLTIVHMTNQGIVKDDDVTYWDYICWLPYVVYNEKKSDALYTAIVDAYNDISVYSEPTFSCKTKQQIQVGSIVSVENESQGWAKISYNNMKGFVLKKFLKKTEAKKPLSSISDEDKVELEKAYAIIGRLLGYSK